MKSGSWVRRSVLVLFWVSATLMATAFAATAPLVGALLVLVPLVLVALVRQCGLGAIPAPVFAAVVIAPLLPTFFVLGDYRTGDGPTVAASLIFLGWALIYPEIVRVMDRQNLREHFSFPDGSVPREPLAEVRVQIVVLWQTASVMVLVGEPLAAALVAAALLTRRRWAAVTAAFACLVLPLVAVAPGGALHWTIHWDAAPLAVLAALVTAHRWFALVNAALWRPRAARPRHRARSRSAAGGGAGPFALGHVLEARAPSTR
ncbi:hypothetical protein BU204_26965 [Actinophytocola xanthii]|uniref:Uncharacterized protein n=2 Tax=Actinophytocola xanthii TaxID=1912961 RepID=A0A1Q8CGT5_9PSEU|nr:hypothetical protein BU204_26965 [Actinophytocola xanthii]